MLRFEGDEQGPISNQPDHHDYHPASAGDGGDQLLHGRNGPFYRRHSVASAVALAVAAAGLLWHGRSVGPLGGLYVGLGQTFGPF